MGGQNIWWSLYVVKLEGNLLRTRTFPRELCVTVSNDFLQTVENVKSIFFTEDHCRSLVIFVIYSKIDGFSQIYAGCHQYYVLDSSIHISTFSTEFV